MRNYFRGMLKFYSSKKWLGIPVFVLVVALSVATSLLVLAATQLTIPSTVNVVSTGGGGGGGGTPTYDIVAYSDAACTANLTIITWGDIQLGGNMDMTIYVKNVGNSTAKIIVTQTGLPTGIVLTAGDLTLYAGMSGSLTLHLAVGASVTVGNVNFNTILTSGAP